MTNNNRDTMRDWIAERLATVEEQGALSMLGLVHVDGAGVDREIHAMRSGGPKWGDAEEMADILWGGASRHAKGLPGAQQFQLQAVYGSATKPLRFLPFMITGVTMLGPSAGGTAFGGLATEAPNAIGQTSQAMRLLEALAQGSFQQVAHSAQNQQKLIDFLMTYSMKLAEENRELFLALRDVFAKMIADSRAHQLEVLKFLRATEERKKLMQLAPAILNMMAGSEVFPRSAEDTAIMEHLVEYVDEPTLNTILAGLSTRKGGAELAGLITSRLAALRKQKAEDKAEMDKLSREASGVSMEEAERDAAGEAVKILMRRTEGDRQIAASPVEAKALVAATQARPANGTNGHTNGRTIPAAPASATIVDETNADTALIDDLFAQIPDAQFDLMIGMLAADDAALAARLKARRKQP